MRVSEARRLRLFAPSLVSCLLDLVVPLFPLLGAEAAIEVATICNPRFLNFCLAVMFFHTETFS